MSPRSVFALSLLLPALALAAGPAPGAAPRKLTLVFNGDNGGEIAPCG